MQTLPIKYFATHAHGDVMSVYTNDVDTLRQMLSQSIPQMFNSVVMIAVTFFAMLFTERVAHHRGCCCAWAACCWSPGTSPAAAPSTLSASR